MNITAILTLLLLHLTSTTARVIPITPNANSTTLLSTSACPDALIPGYCCTEGSLFKLLTCMPQIHKRLLPATAASPKQMPHTKLATADRGLVRRGEAGMMTEVDGGNELVESGFPKSCETHCAGGGGSEKR